MAMQFRIRGGNVQILRETGAEGGRKREPIGLASLSTGELNPRAQTTLSDADRAEITAWVDRHRDIEKRRQEMQFQTLPQLLAEVADWIGEATPEDVQPYADDLQDGMRQMRVALTRKLGGGKRAAED